MKLEFYKANYLFFKEEAVYSFPIYLFDKEREQRMVTLYAGSPVTKELVQEWQNLIAKGAYLQIFHENKDLFLEQTEVPLQVLEDENEYYFRMQRLSEERQNLYGALVKENFKLKEVFKQVSEEDNFMPLIKRVHDEVMCFSLTKSATVSMATELVSKLFTNDIFPVRVTTLAYMIAKQNKITDEETMANLIIACLVKDVGLGLIENSLLNNFDELSGQEIYAKHMMLSIYVLSKADYEFPKLIKRLILEHHEQGDGSGFPRGRKEDYIHPLSFIMNLSDQILMYSSGKLNGRKTGLSKTIDMFHKRVGGAGLNINFPHNITESLGLFLPNDIEKE